MYRNECLEFGAQLSSETTLNDPLILTYVDDSFKADVADAWDTIMDGAPVLLQALTISKLRLGVYCCICILYTEEYTLLPLHARFQLEEEIEPWEIFFSLYRELY